MVDLKDKTILIAEDDIGINEAYVKFFSICFGTVYNVFTGNDAIDILKTKDVDIIVSDVNMPNGSGIDIADYLVSLGSHPPVVFITAYNELLGICDNNSCAICRVKPVRLDEVLEKMKIMLKDKSHICSADRLAKSLTEHRAEIDRLLNVLKDR